MRHYSSPTAKRHCGFINSREVLRLDKGKLREDQRPPKKDRVKTADSYYDRQGVKRWKGNKNLRRTEILEVNYIYMFTATVLILPMGHWREMGIWSQAGSCLD